MPLVNHDQAVVGVIQALNQRDGRPFDARDEQVLAALCAQAGVALDQAQLIAQDRERQRLLQELELARSIQLGLLPDGVPERAGWRFAAWCRSCDQTGGDYYDFVPAADGSLDVVVGDVSGHGVAAALLMSTARAFLRALHLQDERPGELMRRLNGLLAQDMADDAFMTLVLCRLLGDGSLSFVSAGHEPPIVWRAAAGRFDELESTGLALGMLEDGDFGTTVVAPLAPGDVAVLLTDGIVEAHAPPGQELFGADRLREVVRAAAPGGAEAVRAAVVRAVETWMGGTPPHDDMTLVVCQKA
jgi:sigma-B regulation protein RsbU (phosphoserine phosphatase)